MIRRLAPSIAAAALLATGCATSQPSSGAHLAPIRLIVPEVMAWEPEGPYDLKLVIFNGTSMQIQITSAQAEAAQVTLFRPDGSIACKTQNPAKKTYDIWFIRKLNGGKGMELRLDVRPECKDLPAGVYRYEVVYVANNAHGSSAALYQGIFGPETGRVLVRDGATALPFEELKAAVEAPAAAPAAVVAAPSAGASRSRDTEPAGTAPEASAASAPAAAAPDAAAPAAAASAAPAAAALAATAASAPAGTVEPAVSPAEIRACVDRELAARGLNAYGDPKGTNYDSGTPVDEYGRILYVASRNPGIRRTCGIPKF
jgi:hypothetical protein